VCVFTMGIGDKVAVRGSVWVSGGNAGVPWERSETSYLLFNIRCSLSLGILNLTYIAY